MEHVAGPAALLPKADINFGATKFRFGPLADNERAFAGSPLQLLKRTFIFAPPRVPKTPQAARRTSVGFSLGVNRVGCSMLQHFREPIAWSSSWQNALVKEKPFPRTPH